jgi:hypothetical protein
LRRHAVAVGEVELARRIATVEELDELVGDRAALQAIGLVPVECRAIGPLDEVEEAAVVGGDLEAAIAGALDDGGGDRERVEQAGIVRDGEMRSRAQIVRPTAPHGSRRPGYCSLHVRLYGTEGLIRSIFSLCPGLLTGVG